MTTLGICGRAGLAAALLSALPPFTGSGTCQEVRVLVLRPAGAKAVPTDVTKSVERAIAGALPGVVLVESLADATDLVELTEYQWAPAGDSGVRQTWRFAFRPLLPPGQPALSRAGSQNFVILTQGPLDEGTRLATDRLRQTLSTLLVRKHE